MAEDKVIKSGQVTLPRVVFLAICGVVLFLIISLHLLSVGYLLLTLVLSVLLFLVAIDYGVDLDNVEFGGAQGPVPAQAIAASSQAVVAASAPQQVLKTKRPANRPAKRRR
jgi:hypothetical protein